MPWLSTVDSKTGYTYWYNEKGEVTWVDPNAPKEGEGPASVSHSNDSKDLSSPASPSSHPHPHPHHRESMAGGGEDDEEDDDDDDEEGEKKSNKFAGVKGLVSKKKLRFQQDGFDLDLSYITERVIAMGFPSEGLEAAYRNNMKDVQRFFETYHDMHFRVYNLCAERSYPPERFGNSVAHFPFDDHNPCRFDLIPRICKDISSYLVMDPKNVVAVHCKAGKGRTGMIIACYLVWSRLAQTGDHALELFASKRTLNNKGVTIPSQQRYVQYLYEYLHDYLWANIPFSLAGTSMTLLGFRLKKAPNMDAGGGCDPYFVVKRLDGETIYHYKKDKKSKIRAWKSDEEERVLECSVVVKGDFQVTFYDADLVGSDDKMFGFWLHTGFLSGKDSITLTKKQLDKAVKDKKHKIFDPEFTCEVMLTDAVDDAALVSPASLERKALVEKEKENKEKNKNGSGGGGGGGGGKVGKPNRFNDGDLDLDLTYITERIIAMSFPNDMKDVQTFLTKYHDQHYKVFNLCSEKSYPPEKFNNSTAHYPCNDRSPPRFDVLPRFCEDVHSYLQLEPENVVVVHCKDGITRTGCMIAAYLLYDRTCDSADAALAYFATLRLGSITTGMTPSQSRFVHYFEKWLRQFFWKDRIFPLAGVEVTLHSVLLTLRPNFETGGGCTPYFVVLRADGTEVYNYSKDPNYKVEGWKTGKTRDLYCKVEVKGDFRIIFYTEATAGSDTKMFGFWLHTGFLRGSDSLLLNKGELDRAVLDVKCDHFDPGFTFELFFKAEGADDGSVGGGEGDMTNVGGEKVLRKIHVQQNLYESIHEGWLRKQHSHDNFQSEGGWGRRYFALYPDMFMWCPKQGKKPIGMLPLQTIVFVSKVAPPDDKKGTRFDFVVRSQEDTYTFRFIAKNNEECQRWVDVLTEATQKAATHFKARAKDYQLKEYDLHGKFWKNCVDMLLIRSGQKIVPKKVLRQKKEEATAALDDEAQGIVKDWDDDDENSDGEEAKQEHRKEKKEKEEEGEGGAGGAGGAGGENAVDGDEDSEEEFHDGRKVVHKGYLKKKNAKKIGSFKWQVRYFAIYEDSLVYYTKVNGASKGVLPVGDIVGIEHLEKKKKGARFNIMCKNEANLVGRASTENVRVYGLLADSKDDALKWVAALNKWVEAYKQSLVVVDNNFQKIVLPTAKGKATLGNYQEAMEEARAKKEAEEGGGGGGGGGSKTARLIEEQRRMKQLYG